MFQDPWTLRSDLPRGSADAVQVAVTSVATKDGSSLRLPAPGVSAIVGPNNVGKSTLLKELNNLIHNNRSSNNLILNSISTYQEGSDGDFLSWLYEHRPFDSRKGRVPGFSIPASRNPESIDNLLNEWRSKGASVGFAPMLARAFAFYADANSRLKYVQAHQARDDASEPAAHPMHLMQDNPELVTELSELGKLIFRQPLTIDVLSGNICLRVGEVSTPAPPVDRINHEYRNEILSLPKLADQGDGMRSLFGLLIPIICSTYPIVMVDEPEAFLHPPQASALGRELARLAKEKRIQILLATHDRSLLRGLLEGDADVSVIKLDRSDNRTTVRQLVNDELRELWVDPALRYTNALEGLFHRLVVLMEADQDCHFFSAALEYLDDCNESPLPSSEVLFVPCGGKAGIAKLARSLIGAGVKTVASPDLDVLNNSSVMSDLVQAMGGDWPAIEDLYRQATDQFQHRRTRLTVAEVLTAIRAVLEPRSSDLFDEDLRESVRMQMRLDENPWKSVKSFGIAAFKGQYRVNAEELLKELERCGLVLLREGELENLAPELGMRKGPGWLPAALKGGFHRRPACQDHVKRIVKQLG